MSNTYIHNEPLEFSEMIQNNYIVSKPAIQRKAVQFVDNVLESGNPLAVVESLSAIKEFIEAIRKDARLTDCVVTELDKEKGKAKLSSGTKVEKMEAGVTYTYEGCGDEQWHKLKYELELAKDRLKKREDFLKEIPEAGMNVVDTESGEIDTIYPPVKSSTTTYKVVLAAKETIQDIDNSLPF